MNPELSIIVPGIRPTRWLKLYESILESTSKTFELIICGPYHPPKEMEGLRNFKYVKDFGTPVRASMIAADLATGKYITWGADDAVYLPGALDKIINACEEMDSIVVCKYLEGVDGTHKTVQPNNYFTLNGSWWTTSRNFRPDWFLFNTGAMKTSTFKELGGWDCIFQGTFYSHADMAARAYLSGLEVTFDEMLLLDCDHFGNEVGDHSPIELAQTVDDYSEFKQRYNDVSISTNQLKTWKETDPVWGGRFDE